MIYENIKKRFADLHVLYIDPVQIDYRLHLIVQSRWCKQYRWDRDLCSHAHIALANRRDWPNKVLLTYIPVACEYKKYVRSWMNTSRYQFVSSIIAQPYTRAISIRIVKRRDLSRVYRLGAATGRSDRRTIISHGESSRSLISTIPSRGEKQRSCGEKEREHEDHNCAKITWTINVSHANRVPVT